ncbi:MAG TPA: hypothetical protein VL793_00375 [Patescibacteria group bacterium]|nr:hypothetical protein [Patescibacteria group bacterium]
MASQTWKDSVVRARGGWRSICLQLNPLVSIRGRARLAISYKLSVPGPGELLDAAVRKDADKLTIGHTRAGEDGLGMAAVGVRHKDEVDAIESTHVIGRQITFFGRGRTMESQRALASLFWLGRARTFARQR